MISVSAYIINSKILLLHGLIKTFSGFEIACEPFMKLSYNNLNENQFVKILSSYSSNKDFNQVPDPEDWVSFNLEFCKNIGMKSNILNKPTTNLVNIFIEIENYKFCPTIHANKPDKGYLHKDSSECIVIPTTSSNLDIYNAFRTAFLQCQ